MLRALGYKDISRWHMNEGHSSLLTLELLDELSKSKGHNSVLANDIKRVREQCIFTTHTPVESAHDRFPFEMLQRTLGQKEVYNHKEIFCCEGVFTPTFLALNLSGYINGVAQKHAEISRRLFSGYKINAITNGVHAATWAAPSFRDLFDRRLNGWRQDNFCLRGALRFSDDELKHAHLAEKKLLIHTVNRNTNAGMDEEILTIGFARRATAYKRWELIFTDIDRLAQIARTKGKLQLIFSGKAHPQDEKGKEQIRTIFKLKERFGAEIKITFLPNYDMDSARILVAGCDLWLNTPQPPMEASGTSGMKAAINGVPSLSVLDGWWIEGHIENVTGWAIGTRELATNVDDANSLYNKLENIIIPLFYEHYDHYLNIMRHCIALNGSFFNAHRMLKQYVLNAYH